MPKSLDEIEKMESRESRWSEGRGRLVSNNRESELECLYFLKTSDLSFIPCSRHGSCEPKGTFVSASVHRGSRGTLADRVFRDREPETKERDAERSVRAIIRPPRFYGTAEKYRGAVNVFAGADFRRLIYGNSTYSRGEGRTELESLRTVQTTATNSLQSN